MKFSSSEPTLNNDELKQKALQIKELSSRLVDQYMTLIAALYISSDIETNLLVPPTHSLDTVTTMTVSRKGRGDWGFDLDYQFAKIKNPETIKNFMRSYLSDALIIMGGQLKEYEKLTKRYNQYKDFAHDPALEMIYHLRNGVAHGNKFTFTDPGGKRLRDHPAHTRESWGDYSYSGHYEITLDLANRNILFEYMKAGDILDVISNAGVCLQKQATGTPILPSEILKSRAIS